ncbi:hypothetical protein QJQ45_003299 [Haematococcus lacustris]|nr:hypothetical protein QJQ45_003299 [Haematococcus lacustris]
MLLEEYAAVKAEVASRLAALPFVAITVDGWSQVDIQSDTANMADVFFGATVAEKHYEQQAGGAMVSKQDPAALVAQGQLQSLHACLVAAKQQTTPSQFADPSLFCVQPHLAGTPVAIALSWLGRQQELQQ